MTGAKASSPSIGIEPPGLELDLGFSILDARPSVKLKLSFGPLSRKTTSDHFTIPLRKWWVRMHGSRHAKQGLISSTPDVRTSFEDEILRERHLKASDLTRESERGLGKLRQAIEELSPPGQFVGASTLERLKHQSNSWVKLFKEALIQARQNFDRASAEHRRAEGALDIFVKTNGLAAKRPAARRNTWDRIASLAALVLVEGLISLPPVAERQGGQLILSFLIPITVSIANALVGVLVGTLGVYQIRHGETRAARVTASAGVAFAFGIIAWMNISVARWREGNDSPISFNSFLPASALSIVLLVRLSGISRGALH